MDAQARFDALVKELTGLPGVQPPGEEGGRRFDADTLRLDGSIIAMLVDGALVLKLPGDRVADLVESGRGTPWDGGQGRRMRQWVVIVDDDLVRTLALGFEALDFARARPR